MAEWAQWLLEPVRLWRCPATGKLWLCPADTGSSGFPWMYVEQLKNLPRWDAEAGGAAEERENYGTAEERIALQYALDQSRLEAQNDLERISAELALQQLQNPSGGSASGASASIWSS